MVQKSNEALIAEARLAECSECSEEGTSTATRCDGDIIRRLANALEAADQRAAEAEKRWYGEFKASVGEYQKVIDELAAVVEEVREVLRPDEAKLGRTPRSVLEEARSALATAPDDALRDVKAAAWEEGAGDMAEHIDNGAEWEIQNPYQEGQS